MSETVSHPILEATNLSVGYFSKKQPLVVAENISFQFEAGKLIGLVGANGIGKSTLLRTLSGMQKPLNGTVFLNEKPLKSYHALELATQLSVVLTEAPSSKNLSVYEFISLGRQPYTNWLGKLTLKDIEKIKWAMAITDTQKLAARKCFELSDGQLQRVAIARALAQDTPLILLDEPTTHLDLYHRAYVLKLLKKLTRETQKTILFSTHEIDLAIQLSDEMMVLSPEGFSYNDPCQLIEEGKFESLFPKDTVQFDEKIGKFILKDS
ncbi:MAG: ABC transporter ATP-binding protein [Alteromonas sp.]|nr:ABC transporter ATP-binding protein [Alteromonas sp.]MAY23559.1 ABC transporter ATP-binding protein [Flavobacteriaceae bacterium]|tara:strand:+ start:32458 stop:33255 length:798 start_codon:yes stop_codon:yes gene_type:complete